MARTRARWSSRLFIGSIAIVLAFIDLALILNGVRPTKGYTRITNQDLYRRKSTPTSKHYIDSAAITPTVNPKLKPTHPAGRYMSEIPYMDMASSPAEDKPVQSDTQTVEGHPGAKEDKKNTLRGGSDQVQNNDQALAAVAQEAETAQDIPESESDYGEINNLKLPTQSCLVNGDCGSGYRCNEGWCILGCDKHQDCPKGYQCDYGRWGYRCFTKRGPSRECREHLAFCFWDAQCCSGVCGRRARGKPLLCWPKGYPVYDH
ncbi:hypothetical protein N7461_000735 [Penicillium sp. DV-2018c]|nr:hypothetical protein N7461_000735 [Penicillium sp. DV-2018c]